MSDVQQVLSAIGKKEHYKSHCPEYRWVMLLVCQRDIQWYIVLHNGYRRQLFRASYHRQFCIML